jgi:hypothetical protein
LLRRPAQRKDYDPEQYLRDTDSHFLFDHESGIYEPKTYYRAKKRKKFKFFSLSPFQWGTLLLSSFTLVFLVKYTNYACLQWQEMIRTADAAQKTFLEIQKQTTLQRQQMVGTYAAAIPKEVPGPRTISSDLQLLKYMGISMSFRNIGKVKARDFVGDATMTRKRLPDGKLLGNPQSGQITKSELRPYEQTGPNGFANMANIKFATNMFTENDIRLLHDDGETVEISGHFQYDNGFSETIREDFCYTYLKIPQRSFENGNVGTGGGEGWLFCEDGKSLIEQIGKKKP